MVASSPVRTDWGESRSPGYRRSGDVDGFEHNGRKGCLREINAGTWWELIPLYTITMLYVGVVCVFPSIFCGPLFSPPHVFQASSFLRRTSEATFH